MTRVGSGVHVLFILFVHFCCRMCGLGKMHSVTGRHADMQTDRQTADIMIPIADHADSVLKHVSKAP